MTQEDRELFITFFTEQRRGLLAQAAACERMIQALKGDEIPAQKTRYNMRNETTTMTITPVWDREGS